MLKKILYLIIITLTVSSFKSTASTTEPAPYNSDLIAFSWVPISDVDKILQYENQETSKNVWCDKYKLFCNDI